LGEAMDIVELPWNFAVSSDGVGGKRVDGVRHSFGHSNIVMSWLSPA